MSVLFSNSRTAGGTINIASFVMNQPGVELGALQCSAGGIPVGIAQEGPHGMPGAFGPAGASTLVAAQAGQPFRVYCNGEPALLTLGISGCNPDDFLVSDASGNALPVVLTNSSSAQWVGARAVEGGVAGSIIRAVVNIFPYHG